MFDNDNGRAAAPATQPAALKNAADALFGDGFWGRERVNPDAAPAANIAAAQTRR